MNDSLKIRCVYSLDQDITHSPLNEQSVRSLGFVAAPYILFKSTLKCVQFFTATRFNLRIRI
jgi:hypothetical protein